jgi:hypothetical protein
MRTRNNELTTPMGRYVFVAPSVGRKITAALLFLSLGASGLGAYLAAHDAGTPALVLTVAAAVLAVALWASLQARIPQRIEIDRSVVTIIRNGKRERYDLVDPGLELRVRDGQIAFAHYMSPWSVVEARDVDWRVFTDVVMHYQNRADINADLRDQRFSR